MGVKTRQLATLMMVVLGAANLASCGDDRQGAAAPFDDPFDFAEIQGLARPIGAMTPASQAATIPRLHRDNGRTAALYHTAHARFEAIYGDGVGPAKGSREYLDCRAAFTRVDALIGAPQGATDEQIGATRTALARCRKVAEDWSGPAEMATFGNDLRAMANGSMLVLSYAAALSEPDLGQQIYREAAPLQTAARTGN